MCFAFRALETPHFPDRVRSWFQVADTKRRQSPIPQELRTREGLPAVKSNLSE
ncbi:unnamed protein product [Ixodes persulcatus]